MNINLNLIIKAIYRKLIWIIMLPLLVAAMVYYLQKQKPREYVSGMVFYTGLATGQNLSQQGDRRTDMFAVNSAFDNLIAVVNSREVLEEVSMRMLAIHLLMDKPDALRISAVNFELLHGQLLSQALIKELTDGANYEQVYQRIHELYRQSRTNEIIRLLNTSSSFYNVERIRQNLTVRRRGSSDMLEVTYRSTDPGVCLLTLEILAETIVERNRAMRFSEAGGIVEYFIRELERARQQLNEAEERLRDYSQENQVINYSEQTKYLAASKEELERDIYHQRSNVDAARDAIEALEQKFDSRERIYLNSREILERRQSLSELNSRIAFLSILNRPEEKAELENLEARALELEEQLLALSRQLAELSYTRESLPRQSLINQWLVYIIELDKSKAALEVLISQRAYFEDLFNEFAPIGFNLSKMEREIDIAEREYLSILHGLNQARIRQSDFELFGNIDILDKPFFPLNPQSSKTKMLVAAAFLAFFVFVLGLIVAFTILDRSLRSPSMAESYTGLEPLGAMLAPVRNKQIYKEQLQQKLFMLLRNKLAFYLKRTEPAYNNMQIQVFSTRKTDQLALAVREIALALHSLGNRVVCYITEEAIKQIQLPEDEAANIRFVNIYDMPLSPDEAEEVKQGGDSTVQVFMHPQMEDGALDSCLRQHASLNVLLADARQTWDYPDRKILNHYLQSYPDTLHLQILSNVQPDCLDGFVGEVPRRRSFLRKWVKKMLKLNF